MSPPIFRRGHPWPSRESATCSLRSARARSSSRCSARALAKRSSACARCTILASKSSPAKRHGGHVEQYPDIHDKFWNAAKLASQTKQSVNVEAAQNLVAAVDDIATVFWATKGVDYSDPNADVRFGT